MKKFTRGTATLLVSMLLAGLATGAEAVSRRIDRPGTVSLGGGGGYGVILGDGRYGLDFDSGPGYNIVLRYAMTKEWALGFNFENHRYDAIDGLDYGEEVPLDPPDRLVITTFEAQIYRYLRQGVDSRSYALLGIGVYRPEIRIDENIEGLDSGETALFPGENLLLTAGLGIELFLRENWALDLTGRAMAYFGNGIADQELDYLDPTGDVTYGLQARVGLLYFLAR